MKYLIIITGLCLIVMPAQAAAEPTPAESMAKHQDGSAKVADAQDELAADVQQLVIEQTIPMVIDLLKQVEVIMTEATDRLAKADTGGTTIAAQTEIIEKIHAAAKEKQSQGGSKSGGAMMDMMERMMGKQPAGEAKGQAKDGQANDQGGNGISGQSDTANTTPGGQANGKNEARRVPKAAGNASHEIPAEFNNALDAYNRGAEKKLK